MPATRRARKIRQAAEFATAELAREIATPNTSTSVYVWNLPDIRAAVEAQMQGRFALPARMADRMRGDDALFVAKSYRLAPQRALGVALEPAKGTRGEAIAAEAEALYGALGIAVSSDTIADINEELADHGIAFAFNVVHPRDDGSRVDITVHHFPIEFVEWSPTLRAYQARLDGGERVPITHGDGRWIIFRKHSTDAHKRDAAIIPAALVWARHAFAARDWSKGSAAHGNAKVVGELPEGIDIQSEHGQAFLALLRALVAADAPVGIRPFGSKTEYISNSSNAWQVWQELMNNAEKAAARIYNGTDGLLGAQGGAPGIDITKLFGVAVTIVQGDLAAIERGLLTGSIEVWTAINFGDSSLAPRRVYLIPDADREARLEAKGKRIASYLAAVKAARDAGGIVDQEYADTLAKEYDVPPVPIATAAPAEPSVSGLGWRARLSSRRPTLAMVSGIPASGKSTFAKTRLAHLTRINRDDAEDRGVQMQAFAEAIEAEASIVVDDTNTTKAIRSEFIVPALAAGYRIEGYQMESNVDACLERNANREAYVPPVAIHTAAKRLEPMTWDEGFDEISDVRIIERGYEIAPQQR
jgi:predicted kinase